MERRGLLQDRAASRPNEQKSLSNDGQLLNLSYLFPGLETYVLMLVEF